MTMRVQCVTIMLVAMTLLSLPVATESTADKLKDLKDSAGASVWAKTKAAVQDAVNKATGAAHEKVDEAEVKSGGIISDAAEKLKGATHGIIDTISGKVEEKVEPKHTILGDAADAVHNMVNKITGHSDSKVAIDEAHGIVADTAAKVNSAFNSVIDSVTGKAKDVTADPHSSINDATLKVQRAGSSVTDSVTGAVHNILNKVSEHMPSGTEKRANHIVDDAASTVKDAASSASSTLSGLLHKVTGTTEKKVEENTGVFSDATGKIKDLAGSATNAIKDAADSIIDKVSGSAKNVEDEAHESEGILSGIYHRVTGQAREKVEEKVEEGSGITGKLKDAAQSVMGKFTGAAEDDKDTSKATATTAAAAAKALAEKSAENSTGIFTWVMNKVTGAPDVSVNATQANSTQNSTGIFSWISNPFSASANQTAEEQHNETSGFLSTAAEWVYHSVVGSKNDTAANANKQTNASFISNVVGSVWNSTVGAAETIVNTFTGHKEELKPVEPEGFVGKAKAAAGAAWEKIYGH